MSFLDTYGTTHRAAVPGMVANSRPKDTLTGIVEDAGGIAFAKAVYQGTNDKQVTGVPAADAFIGITIRDVTLVHTASADVDKYLEGENCGILRRGVIWVTAGAAVAKREPVYVTPAGAFTNVAGGGANFLIPNAVYDSSAGNGEIVRVELG